MNEELVKLIEEVCRSVTGASNRLSACFSKSADLKLSPEMSRQVIAELTSRARLGNAPAKAFLGNAYLNGWGVKVDIRKALEYARHAASLGDAGGEVLVGFFYAQGLGPIVRNYNYALSWFKKALEKGNDMAANNIGAVYEDGLGVKKDLNMALKYYREAASQGNELAKKNLERLKS